MFLIRSSWSLSVKKHYILSGLRKSCFLATLLKLWPQKPFTPSARNLTMSFSHARQDFSLVPLPHPSVDMSGGRDRETWKEESRKDTCQLNIFQEYLKHSFYTDKCLGFLNEPTQPNPSSTPEGKSVSTAGLLWGRECAEKLALATYAQTTGRGDLYLLSFLKILRAASGSFHA